MVKRKTTVTARGSSKNKNRGKKNGKRTQIAWMSIAVFLAVVAMFAVWRKWWSTDTVPAAVRQYSVFGVDVSKHSGKIDWEKLKVANVRFAYVKATEGEDYEDPLFDENFNAAKESGILVGAYHFFRFSKDGKKQAQFFAKTAKVKKGDLLPVLDVEHWGNTLSTRPDKEVKREIGRYLTEVERLTGARPMIYTNLDAYNRYIKGTYDIYPLWFCDLDEEPTLDAPGWDFWQYSHRGKVTGAKHEIDFNVFRRSVTELKSWFLVR
ncbi:MAG: GH25 family lysozyme [Breznakibacter sp.]